MANENTVTIPLEEYFELRQKADMNAYLMNELGRIEARFVMIEQRICKCDDELWRLRDGK